MELVNDSDRLAVLKAFECLNRALTERLNVANVWNTPATLMRASQEAAKSAKIVK